MSVVPQRLLAAASTTCRQLFLTTSASRGAHVHFPGTVKATISDHKKEYSRKFDKGDKGGGALVSEENKAEMMQVSVQVTSGLPRVIIS